MTPQQFASRFGWRLPAWLLCGLAGALIGLSGLGQGIENTLRELDARIRQHPASGALHIVEIDAHSIATIDRWPWPRSNHARVVDQLRRAGAASIVFDVDFSAHSTPAEDAAFADALRRAGGKVVLPAFRQRTGGNREGWTDSMPIPALRGHSAAAAVSILPDHDGYVRRAPIGVTVTGLPRPSLSATLAGVAGSSGQDFPIDFAIAPASIPRHSLVEIRDGRFDPREIAGKHILIGATAIELGDRYAVPTHGVLPGVVIQALAAETLARGVPRESGWPIPLIAALALAVAILRAPSRARLAAAAVSAPAVLFALAVMIRAGFNWSIELAPALVALACATATAIVGRLLAAARSRREHDTETGLPNRFAFLDQGPSPDAAGIVAARIAEFDKLSAGLGESARGALIHRVRDRVVLAMGTEQVFRIEDRVLAWRFPASEDLLTRLATLRTLMLSPVEVAGRRVDVTLALGFAAQGEAEGADNVLAQAVLAANHALDSGESWHIHEREDEELIDRELSLLGELDAAIGNGEIQVVYQPKLCLRSETIVSVEALVRWNHPTRGPLRPDLFIPLAERSDRIAGLTLHVVERTIADLQVWRGAGHGVSAAVNISAKLLTSALFNAELRQLVARSILPPRSLIFEVTESAAMRDIEGAAAALRSFRELGIAISMDDYGTGQSTLSYLKQLPLDELKIDRSFVEMSHLSRSDGALVRSTINLAHELGLKVVAEGVGDEACLAFLRTIGCDLAQGYFIGRPMPPGELAARLAAPRALAA